MKPKPCTPEEPMTPAAANLARALQRDREQRMFRQAWWQTMIVLVSFLGLLAYVVCEQMCMPLPPAAPVGKAQEQEREREPVEGMWLEVRDVLATETAAVVAPDFIMPTPAVGLPEPLDRRKPRRLETPERIDR
jgi:hypothetical protein